MEQVSWSEFVRTSAYHEMQIGLQAAGYHLAVTFGKEDKNSVTDVHMVRVPDSKKLGPEITDF